VGEAQRHQCGSVTRDRCAGASARQGWPMR
jgi:hypothetical protein